MKPISVDIQTPFKRFEEIYHELFLLAQQTQSKFSSQEARLVTTTFAVAMVEYFEAFCRTQFIAIAELRPELLQGFGERLKTVTGSGAPTSSGMFGSRHVKNVVDVQNLRFDSGEAINAVFSALVGRAPLNGEECIEYRRLQAGRLKILYGQAECHDIKEGTADRAKSDFGWPETGDRLFDLAVNIARTTGVAVQSKLDPTAKDSANITNGAKVLLQGHFDTLD